MIIEHFGKPYNGERAIISLTTWVARVNTVGITLYSLLKSCPAFHIVLVLSTDEFTHKEADLPSELIKMTNANLFEILWIRENIKSFKKVIPTQIAYPDIPVISADDDALYKKNYAALLYSEYLRHRQPCLIYLSSGGGTGYGCLFSPNVLKNAERYLIPSVINTNNDDALYYAISEKQHITRYYTTENKYEYVEFHNTNNALNTGFLPANTLANHRQLMLNIVHA